VKKPQLHRHSTCGYTNPTVVAVIVGMTDDNDSMLTMYHEGKMDRKGRCEKH